MKHGHRVRRLLTGCLLMGLPSCLLGCAATMGYLRDDFAATADRAALRASELPPGPEKDNASFYATIAAAAAVGLTLIGGYGLATRKKAKLNGA